ncbi:restriction endonuclease, partial [Candidatus Parcubacteria bacterium]|nr:restriction endonuclease [Candidatus Parcubacteria bacterium]
MAAKTNKIFVINQRGEREPFSFRKVYQSARKCGASKETALKIASAIEREVFDGISTRQIFDRIFELLFEKSPFSAIRFNLKRAIQKLGPTGFPFEKFVAKIFESEGFEVKINQIIPGQCVNYEIDFLAKKENFLYIGECKFRQEPGGRVDLKAALANYARFLDIQAGKFLNSNTKQKSIIVTNAKFTIEAIKYSECVGV